MPETQIIECPFCKKKAVKAIHFPPILQTRTTQSGAAGSKTIYYYTKEKYETVSGCSNCGKSQKEVEKAMKQTKKDVKKENKILKKLKERGLDFTNIETKM